MFHVLRLMQKIPTMCEPPPPTSGVLPGNTRNYHQDNVTDSHNQADLNNNLVPPASMRGVLPIKKRDRSHIGGAGADGSYVLEEQRREKKLRGIDNVEEIDMSGEGAICDARIDNPTPTVLGNSIPTSADVEAVPSVTTLGELCEWSENLGGSLMNPWENTVKNRETGNQNGAYFRGIATRQEGEAHDGNKNWQLGPGTYCGPVDLALYYALRRAKERQILGYEDTEAVVMRVTVPSACALPHVLDSVEDYNRAQHDKLEMLATGVDDPVGHWFEQVRISNGVEVTCDPLFKIDPQLLKDIEMENLYRNPYWN